MDAEELIRLMKERWTARKFKSKDVKEDDLKKILEAGRWSPSGGNKQPWELIVIRDEELKDEIARLYAEGMGMSKPPERYTTPPVLIAVGIDRRIIDSYPDMMPAEFVVYASIGSMVQNMSITAASLGMVLSWGTQPSVIQGQVEELLEVPDHIEVPDILQLGYPAQDKYSSDRREIDDFLHHDKLDKTKLRDV